LSAICVCCWGSRSVGVLIILDLKLTCGLTFNVTVPHGT